MSNKIDSIQVLGSGCPTCKKLFELTSEAVKQLGLEVEVEYVTDIQKMIEMGVMQSPVLAVNGKPVMTGSVSDIETIKEFIIKGNSNHPTEPEEDCGCKCGGKC